MKSMCRVLLLSVLVLALTVPCLAEEITFDGQVTAA